MTDDQVLDRARAILRQRRIRRGVQIKSPDHARKEIGILLQHHDEQFAALYLDTRHRIIEWVVHFTGTINGAAVYPRVLVRKAIELNASAVILAHNHPSGVAEPSNADERITDKIREALNLIDVRVIDHLVVADDTTVSFAERGKL